MEATVRNPMSELDLRAERLRQTALGRVRQNQLESALELYDEALLAAESEELRELITINKGDLLIAMQKSGPEVQALATILMRRRNLHHAFLAAYALTYKHRLQNETKRAIFYGQVALNAAQEAGEPLWKLGALNELGSLYEMDSRFDNAISCFEEALGLVDHVQDAEERQLSRGAALQNLGASRMLNGEAEAGVGLVLEALPSIVSPSSLAEAYIDLCYGYVELENLEEAIRFGEMGLALASEDRQVRNAHYLLGEAAYKSGDIDTAESHFEQLAKFYPDFRHLKHLLMAIDLRSMVNLKL